MRESMALRGNHAHRLQTLARADERFLPRLASSPQRGYERTHTFVGKLRVGTMEVELHLPELGIAVAFAEPSVEECETMDRLTGSRTAPARFTRGYGSTLGTCGPQAIFTSHVDRAPQRREFGKDTAGTPARDAAFAPMHADDVRAAGVLADIEPPRYVDFESRREPILRLRREAAATGEAAE